MKRQDWLLVVLAAAEDKGLTPVRLQKSLFLLGENFDSEVGQDFYQFRPYNYGPFDSNVYEDAEIMESQGLIQIRTRNRGWPDYLITPAGQKKATLIANTISDRALGYITSVVRWTQSLGFQDLVREIYNKYPAMRANSVFRG